MGKKREGPTKRVVTIYDCAGCRWLDRRLLKRSTAEHLEYESNCDHPAERLPIENGKYLNRFIGSDTRTPDWCPVLQAKSDA